MILFKHLLLKTSIKHQDYRVANIKIFFPGVPECTNCLNNSDETTLVIIKKINFLNLLNHAFLVIKITKFKL